MELFLLILSQFSFSFLRTANVRYTAATLILPAMITSALLKVAWLISTGLGIKALLELDILSCTAYVLSGLIGDYLSFKLTLFSKL